MTNTARGKGMRDLLTGQGGRVKGRPKTRLNAALFAMALEEMVEGPTTRDELIEHTGLSRQTILSLVTALHMKGLIHIAAWEKDSRGGTTIAAFQLGRKKDATKPPPRTNAQCQREWKARKASKAVLLATAGVSTGATA